LQMWTSVLLLLSVQAVLESAATQTGSLVACAVSPKPQNPIQMKYLMIKNFCIN